MSDNLPLEMQLEIMIRLPVKSLIQFRSVSKAWYSLITSSDFIGCHNAHRTQTQHLLVRYKDTVDHKDTFVSVVDDVTFPKHKVSVVPTMLPKMLRTSGVIIGCYNGLLCIYGDSFDDTLICIIWNITIRKEVAVVLQNNVGKQKHIYDLGFGVCRETNDPMIVKIVRIKSWSFTDTPHQVEVFTLSTGVWRSLGSKLLPRISTGHVCLQVEGCLYWLATKNITLNGGVTSYNLIVLFDMKSKEFNHVNLPDYLANLHWLKIRISKIRESLVVLELVHTTTSIWRAEDGVPNSFTKLFTVDVDVLNPYGSLRGFRNNGEPIVEVLGDNIGYKLVVYDPYSKHIDSLRIVGLYHLIGVHPYKETLIMLDQPNLKVYELESVHNYKLETLIF